MTTRAEVTGAADRGQGRLVVADHGRRRHRPGAAYARWSTRSRRCRARGSEVVLVSSGAIAGRSLAAGAAQAPEGAGHPAGGRLGRPGAARAPLHRGVRPPRRRHRPGAAHARRRDPRSHYRNAFQTFARLLELGVVPVVNENDTVATTEIRFGDNDRLAGPRSPTSCTPTCWCCSPTSTGLYDGPPSRPGAPWSRTCRRLPLTGSRSVGPAPPGSALGHADQLEAAGSRTGCRHPSRTDLCGRAAEGARRALGREPCSTATGRRGPAAAQLAHATEAKGTDPARRRRGPRALRSGGRRCSRPASPASPARSSPATRSTCWRPTVRGRAGAGELRRGGAPDAPGAVHPRPRPRAGSGLRAEVVHRDDLVVLPR
jgi:glutamate 5-kinase